MKINFNKIKQYLPITLILTLAVFLRIFFLSQYGDFWGDEMFSFTYSQKPWLDSIKFWLWETNPPLHLFLLKIWFYLVPANEITARLLSIIIGTASVFFLYKLTRKIFNQKIALLAAFFLAVHPYHIFVSITARTYALLILLSILSVTFFYQIFIEKNKNRKNFFGYAAINLLLLFSHLTAAVVLLSQIVALLIINRREFVSWIKIMIIPGIIWLAWMIPSLTYKISLSFFGTAWYFGLNKSGINLLHTLQSVFQGPNNKYLGGFIIIAFFVFLFLDIYKQKKTNKINPHIITFSTFILIPFLLFTFTGMWNIKFFIITMPWTVVLTAYLFNQYLPQSLTYIAIILLAAQNLIGLSQILPINNWQTVNNYLSQKYNTDQKQTVIYEHFFDKMLIDRYYQANIPAIPYTEGNQASQPVDYSIITTNYAMYIRPEQEIKKWLDDNNVEKNDEIFLLHKDDLGININKKLEERGWILVDTFYPRLLEYTELLHYVRNK